MTGWILEIWLWLCQINRNKFWKNLKFFISLDVSIIKGKEKKIWNLNWKKIPFILWKSFLPAKISKNNHFTNLLHLRFKFDGKDDLKLVLPSQIVEINCWSQFIESFNKPWNAYGSLKRLDFRRFFQNRKEISNKTDRNRLGAFIESKPFIWLVSFLHIYLYKTQLKNFNSQTKIFLSSCFDFQCLKPY